MRAPHFWKTNNFKAELLLPVGVMYYLFLLLKEKLTTPESFEVPLLCVGNFTLGGAGKTPTALAVAELLKEDFSSIAFVSRGYGGKLKGPLKVDPATHTAKQVGDEPLLLARRHPCYIARRRAEGIRLAIKEGATLVILDDGMQNPTIKKSLTLAVVDGGYGFGNGLLFPSGPLREPLPRGLKRTDAFVFIGTDLHLVKGLLPASIPLFGANIEPQVSTLPRRDYLAFAGIGRPEKFFETLVHHGIFLRHAEGFPDHHHYDEDDVKYLEGCATEFLTDEFITTEKDAVRLPPDFAKRVRVFPIALMFEAPEKLREFLLSKLSKGR